MFFKRLLYHPFLSAALVLVAIPAFHLLLFGQQSETTLTGRITDETGKPLSDVEFQLYRKCPCDACIAENRPCRYCCATGKSAVAVVTTDEKGVYNFNGVEPGSYLLLNSVNGNFAGLEATVEVRANRINKIRGMVLDIESKGSSLTSPERAPIKDIERIRDKADRPDRESLTMEDRDAPSKELRTTEGRDVKDRERSTGDKSDRESRTTKERDAEARDKNTGDKSDKKVNSNTSTPPS